ncbi:MAG: prepilin-type N-terminal cleavage/methylation domain-containing protein [Candidatus Peribacteria bacterium]|nr:MAG: prepilin-type N-terminal cleavage/methylation domain-containing protein [Candidatus Peribacteria bacterium]
MQTNIDIPSRASFPTNGRSKGFTLPEHSGPDKLAFTLVELIVVVVILGILSTVGFVSYSSYLA